jgi:WbqC-like protein family
VRTATEPITEFDDSSMTTLAVLQPGYLPWLGFFDQVARSDIFVLYDDAQFDKHGWRNRNRVKSAKGPVWLTVPVLHSGRMGQPINKTEIDARSPWAKKQIRTIAQLYAKAPFVTRYLPEIEEILLRPWQRLAELDNALSLRMCQWFGIERRLYLSSELNVGGDRNGRLINLCRHFGVSNYLSGNGAQDYLDVAAFGDFGISVEWQNFNHPIYPQLHGPFVSHLSAIDLLLNVGPESAAVLQGARAGGCTAG